MKSSSLRQHSQQLKARLKQTDSHAGVPTHHIRPPCCSSPWARFSSRRLAGGPGCRRCRYLQLAQVRCTLQQPILNRPIPVTPPARGPAAPAREPAAATREPAAGSPVLLAADAAAEVLCAQASRGTTRVPPKQSPTQPPKQSLGLPSPAAASGNLRGVGVCGHHCVTEWSGGSWLTRSSWWRL